MIKAHEHGINTGTVNFNRYYDEGEDTTVRAEQALRNLLQLLNERIEEVTDESKQNNED